MVTDFSDLSKGTQILIVRNRTRVQISRPIVRHLLHYDFSSFNFNVLPLGEYENTGSMAMEGIQQQTLTCTSIQSGKHQLAYHLLLGLSYQKGPPNCRCPLIPLARRKDAVLSYLENSVWSNEETFLSNLLEGFWYRLPSGILVSWLFSPFCLLFVADI